MGASLPADNAAAPSAVQAIRSGDTDSLQRLLQDYPGLSNTRVDGQRTLLHVATDWPGHFPNNSATVTVLIAAGAGVQVQEVNRLLNQFEQMQGMMKKMKGGGLMKMMKRMGGMKGLPGMGR